MGPQGNQLAFSPAQPNDPNKEGKGKLNYDGVYGWVESNPMGGESLSVLDKYGTNHNNRAAGLPGSKP